MESKLMNQGSYGCIYYPSLPFKLQKQRKQHKHLVENDDSKRKFYVSKLQKHNFHSEFEDYIGKKIQGIPSYDIFFVPVLSTQKIDLATIKQTYVTDCEAIRKYIKHNAYTDKHKSSHHMTSTEYKTLNKKFIVQKMRYINGLYLHRYLLQAVSRTTKQPNYNTNSDSDSDRDRDSEQSDNDADVSKTLRKDEEQIKKYRSEFKQEETANSYHLMSIVFDIYERIMDSIQLLIQYKIVHYDLKENNILIERTQKLPYIIDFGLSIDVERLLEHPWSEKEEEEQRTKSKSQPRVTIDSNVLYHPGSSKMFRNNYLWKQHFYVHAPDYFLWPIEIHLMTYLINEHDTLTEESLRRICYEFIRNNRVIEYMSSDFKKKMFDLSISTFYHFIDQPREKVLNELLKYWDKWDMYAINIMFLKIMYELIFERELEKTPTIIRVTPTPTQTPTPTPTPTQTQTPTTIISEKELDSDSHSLNEERQQKLDPHYSAETIIEFKSKYKVKLKQKYNSYKIMNTLQVMLRNIHPNPDKRMTPEETKAFFVSIFYEC